MTVNDDRYTLNIWDVGGQRMLRPYWRNYFEQTDALVWVVDSSDRLRIQDCKEELHSLLQEDVRYKCIFSDSQLNYRHSVLRVQVFSYMPISKIWRVQWRPLKSAKYANPR